MGGGFLEGDLPLFSGLDPMAMGREELHVPIPLLLSKVTGLRKALGIVNEHFADPT